MGDKSKIWQEKLKKILEKIGSTDTSAFYNDLKTNIEALSAYQSEIELQNLKLDETLTKLQKQNNTYFHLFNNAPLAYIIVNSSNVIKNINQAACSMLGCISEEVIGTPFTRLIHPEFKDFYNPYIKSLAENNEPHSCEIKLISLPDSKYFFSTINGSQQLLAEGEEPTYLLALTNITQQKETEEKLAEESQKVKDSEKLLNEMGKIAKIGGWELDCTTMQQVWTDETYTIHDREKGVYNPNSTEELSRFEPGSKEIIEKAFEAAFTKGEPYDLELEMTTIKGNRKWVRAVCSPILKDDKVSKLTGTLQDISRRKQAEKRVLETKENYKNIFENNPLPMWVYDLETLSFMAINDAALVKYGYTREEFLKMTILDIRPKEDQTRLIRNISSVTEGLDEAGYWKHLKKNGEIIDVEITSHTLSYFGRKAELVVANDITERKKAERRLLESEERYRKLAENFPDTTISFFNRDLVVTFVTGQELIKSGKTTNDFIGKRFDELLIPSLISLANKSYNDAFNGRINSFEAKSFNDRYIRVIALPLVESDGTINEIQVISQNITEQKKSEEKLRESLEREQFLGNLIRNASVAVGVGYPDGQLGMCNLAFQKLTGYSEEDLKNIAWNTLLTPPEWLEKELIFLTELDRTKQPVTYEKEYLHKSGKRIPIELFVHPFFDPDGNVTHYYAFITDITERKKAEENIRKSEHILRLFVEHSPAAIAMFDCEMRYIVHSKRYLTDYRLPEHDLTGHSHYEIFPEMDEIRKEIHRRCLSGEVVKCEEDALPRTDGTQDYVRYELRPWYEDEKNIGGLIFFSEVITERKQAQAALEENERRLRKILETTSDGFWIVDFNRNFIEVNEAYCKMSGYTRKELLDMKISDLEATESTMDTNERILKISKTGGDRFETVHRRKDSSLFDVEVSVNMLDQEQGLMICFCRDITDRKNAEKQLREREAELNNAQELAQMASWRIDLKNYQLSVSKNYKKLIGLEDETIDVAFDYFISRVHPDDVHLMNLENYQLTPESLPVSSDFRIRMPDGSVKWFQNSMVGEFAEGKLIALKGTNIDITEKKKREDEIRSQNEKLSAILNSLPDKLFVHDEKGNFLEAYTTNPDGYIVPINQFMGKNLSDIFPKEVADLNLKHLKECLNRKELITHEFSTNYKNTYATFEVRVVPFMNNKAIRFVRDITQSKEYERQIVKLNKAIEQSPVAIVITDINANITYVSRAFEVITGYTKDEVIGENTRIMKSGKNKADIYTDMWSTIKSGETWKGELINKKKDRTLYWEALSITPLYENSSQITGYLAVKQDITDKKNREQDILDLNASLERKVAERTAELRDLYNNAPCGYHSLDSKGVFEMVNDTELVWLGYAREDLIGKQTFRDLLTEESKRIFENNFEGFKKRGYVNDLEFDMVCKNGNILSVLLNATAIKDKNGNFVRSRSTIIDHTQRKKAEEALKEALQNLEAANKELEAFSYSVSHDLRAPLRAIGGFTRILIEDYSNRFDDEGKRICDVIMSSSEKMGKLIDDLLAFSRFGRSEMSLSKLNMEPLIRSVIQELTTPKSMERIHITIEPLPDVRVDATLMKQVWMNLISNAIKYSSQKEKATIEISTLLSEGEVIFKIKDNGSGFEMQYVDKLFGVFQRLHKESEFEGTGVGLAIVKRIINRHGGRVWAESKLNEGATFYLSLPKYE